MGVYIYAHLLGGRVHVVACGYKDGRRSLPILTLPAALVFYSHVHLESHFDLILPPFHFLVHYHLTSYLTLSLASLSFSRIFIPLYVFTRSHLFVHPLITGLFNHFINEVLVVLTFYIQFRFNSVIPGILTQDQCV